MRTTLELHGQGHGIGARTRRALFDFLAKLP